MKYKQKLPNVCICNVDNAVSRYIYNPLYRPPCPWTPPPVHWAPGPRRSCPGTSDPRGTWRESPDTRTDRGLLLALVKHWSNYLLYLLKKNSVLTWVMSMKWEELRRIYCTHTLAPQPRTDPATMKCRIVTIIQHSSGQKCHQLERVFNFGDNLFKCMGGSQHEECGI